MVCGGRLEFFFETFIKVVTSKTIKGDRKMKKILVVSAFGAIECVRDKKLKEVLKEANMTSDYAFMYQFAFKRNGKCYVLSWDRKWNLKRRDDYTYAFLI